MAIHLGGFMESIDPAGAFANLAALSDDRLFTSGDDLRVPSLNQVLMVAAGVASGATKGARLTSPTLDALVRLIVAPYNGGNDGNVEPDSPPAVLDLTSNPLALGVDEILQAEVDSDPTAAAYQWVLLWFSDGAPTPVSGQPVFTARATGSTTLTAGAWTSVNITLDENLPPGNYQVVGLRAQSAGLVAARIVFRTGAQWRPGVLGCDADTDLDMPHARYGGLGVLGEFPFTQLPAVECLSVSADTSETVYLDLVRTR